MARCKSIGEVQGVKVSFGFVTLLVNKAALTARTRYRGQHSRSLSVFRRKERQPMESQTWSSGSQPRCDRQTLSRPPSLARLCSMPRRKPSNSGRQHRNRVQHTLLPAFRGRAPQQVFVSSQQSLLHGPANFSTLMDLLEGLASRSPI